MGFYYWWEIIALVNMSNCPLQPKICVIEMSVVVGDYLSLHSGEQLQSLAFDRHLDNGRKSRTKSFLLFPSASSPLESSVEWWRCCCGSGISSHHRSIDTLTSHSHSHFSRNFTFDTADRQLYTSTQKPSNFGLSAGSKMNNR